MPERFVFGQRIEELVDEPKADDVGDLEEGEYVIEEELHGEIGKSGHNVRRRVFVKTVVWVWRVAEECAQNVRRWWILREPQSHCAAGPGAAETKAINDDAKQGRII